MIFSGLVLAAGESERMGTPKMLLPWKGRTVLEQVIQGAFDGGVQEVVVVLGSDKEKIQEKLQNNTWSKPLRMVFNPDFKKGMLSSIQAGIKEIDKKSDAVLLALGDQPSIPSRIYRELLDFFPSCGKGILVPRYKGKGGHPMVISRKYFDFIFSLDPQKDSLHSLTKSFFFDIFHLEVSAPEILQDIDRPEDFEALSKKGE